MVFGVGTCASPSLSSWVERCLDLSARYRSTAALPLPQGRESFEFIAADRRRGANLGNAGPYAGNRIRERLLLGGGSCLPGRATLRLTSELWGVLASLSLLIADSAADHEFGGQDTLAKGHARMT